MPDNDLQIENRIYRLRISRYRRFLFLLLGAGVLAVLENRRNQRCKAEKVCRLTLRKR